LRVIPEPANGRPVRWLGEQAVKVQLLRNGAEPVYSAGQLAAALGGSASTIHLYAAQHPELRRTQAPLGAPYPAPDVHDWARLVASGRNAGPPTMRWAAYDQAHDAIWDVQAGDWVQVEGALITRPASRRPE